MSLIGQSGGRIEGMLTSTGPRAARVRGTISRSCGFALSFRRVFVLGLSVAVSYATMLLVVVRKYRKGYGIKGKRGPAPWSAAKN